MNVRIVGAFLLALTLTHAANAAPSLQVKGGNANLTVSPDFISDLGPCVIARIKPATYNDRKTRATFTIGAGVLDGATLNGELLLRGGLNFVCPDTGKSVSMHNLFFTTQSLSVDPASTGTESPMVSGAVAVDDSLKKRINLFSVSENVEISRPGKKRAEIQNVKLRLTREGADLLNSELQTTAFAGGQKMGTASAKIKMYESPKSSNGNN